MLQNVQIDHDFYPGNSNLISVPCALQLEERRKINQSIID